MPTLNLPSVWVQGYAANLQYETSGTSWPSVICTVADSHKVQGGSKRMTHQQYNCSICLYFPILLHTHNITLKPFLNQCDINHSYHHHYAAQYTADVTQSPFPHRYVFY